VLNNRELASVILIAAAVIVASFSKSVRSGLWPLARSALTWKLSVLWLTYATVLAGVTYGLQRVGLRYDDSTKDAVVWGLVAGLPLLVKFDHLGKEQGLMREMALSAVRLTALVEFFVNLYIFPFWVEVLFQSLIVPLAVMSVVADRSDENRLARKRLDWMLSLAGCVILVVVARHLLLHRYEVDVRSVLFSFTQPLALTIAVLGLAWAVGLKSSYEQAFMHISGEQPSRRRRIRAKLALFLTLHVHLRQVRNFEGTLPWQLAATTSWSSARQLLRVYKSGVAPSFTAGSAAESRMTDMVGFGGSRDDWDRIREPRAEYASGSVYGPDVRSRQPRYTTVDWADRRTIFYTLNFTEGTSLAEARRQVLLEFADGASISRSRRGSSCHQEAISTDVPSSSGAQGHEPVVAYFTTGDEPLDDEDICWALLSVDSVGHFADC
jgi:hypothetical protein